MTVGVTPVLRPAGAGVGRAALVGVAGLRWGPPRQGHPGDAGHLPVPGEGAPGLLYIW